MTCGNVYDVRNFGAQGNGTANDALAIQSAIDAAAAAGGGVVCLPAGRYRLVSMLVPKPRVSIHGEARAPSIILPQGPPTQPIWAFRASEPAHVHYECEFADLTIQGDGDASGINGSGTQLGGVNLERCDYVTFRNVRIERFSAINGFGIALGGCFWTVLDRCFFQFNQGVDCDLYVQGNGCNQTVIRDCEFIGNNMPSAVGVRVRGTQNVFITGCDFEGSGNGDVGVDLQGSDGITLIGNYLELWVGPAIRGSIPALGGSSRVVIEGNVINSTGAIGVDLNNTGLPNRRWLIHHNRFGDMGPSATCVRLGNAAACITYANDTDAPTNLLDTVPGQVDNRPFVGYVGTDTWNPPNLADGAVTSKLVTVPGARVGDPALASLSTLPAGPNLLLTAFVQANDTVRCVLMNKNGSNVDVPSGTVQAVVLKQLV